MRPWVAPITGGSYAFILGTTGKDGPDPRIRAERRNLLPFDEVRTENVRRPFRFDGA